MNKKIGFFEITKDFFDEIKNDKETSFWKHFTLIMRLRAGNSNIIQCICKSDLFDEIDMENEEIPHYKIDVIKIKDSKKLDYYDTTYTAERINNKGK